MAKTLALPFFGAGFVDLPPLGVKRTKNAGKMQLIFFLHSGKVSVSIGGTEFAISKGGFWQVPRGNFYAIENRSETVDARIFFAQGCEMEPEGAEEGEYR
jgi:centromere protein C